MKIIDVLGKPCPIPVVEARKVLAGDGADGVLVKVDNFVSVQNLEKMAIGEGFFFSYFEHPGDKFDVTIKRQLPWPPARPRSGGGENGEVEQSYEEAPGPADARDKADEPPSRLTVVISHDAFGGGAEALGRILIKGFIYSLSELERAPEFVIFLNAGAFLTSARSNALDDLWKLEERGTKVLTCGTCVNFYGLPVPAVGEITDMYGIAEKMANAGKLLSI